jgi:hypothetical protein
MTDPLPRSRTSNRTAHDACRLLARVSHGGSPPGNPAARDLRGNGREANRRLEAWPKVREPA